MSITLGSFLHELVTNPALCIVALLTLGVILVNGWTDAPNAIATCVSTRAMHPKLAIIMAAIFNFLGVLVMTIFNAKVAQKITKMVDFGGNSHDALIALCAALFGIVIWATAAWAFGIPTSESHALIAGISGAAIALQGGMKGINGEEWINVVYGLFLSTFIGFGLGYFITKIIGFSCKRMDRRKTRVPFQYSQIGGAAWMAFMHGAQDGQKFMGVFLLGIFLAKGSLNVENGFVIPIWLMVLCSAVMAIGTSIGGYRIIKTVGMGMVKMETYQGFSADAAAAISIFMASNWGIPVSTTHTKTTAIMGVGSAKRLSTINWSIVREMVAAWVLTFPGCGLLGYVMALLFMAIF